MVSIHILKIWYHKIKRQLQRRRNWWVHLGERSLGCANHIWKTSVVISYKQLKLRSRILVATILLQTQALRVEQEKEPCIRVNTRELDRELYTRLSILYTNT